MKPPRPRIVKPRLVWRLIGGNWTPFHTMAVLAALIWGLNLLPPQWGYDAGKWTRAAIGLPPIEARDD